MMLTAATAMTVLIAPAGAGKSHTMAEFARLWTSFTGRRVIGLTTSTNAARVLEHEGLAESYNIAEFLGKIEGSDELRRPVPLHQDDVLVLDEASQLSTADLAMIQEAARQAGARIIATGDTRQLGAVDAGGMFRLLAQEVPAAELHEVRRFERSGSGRPASGSATATWPRSPPTTGTAGSGAPTRKPPTSGPRRCGSRTTCAARTCCCSPGPTPKPPNYPGACRPGSSSSARWAAAGRPVRREPGRRRRPDPGPPQHRDRRRRPEAHQPGHAEDHRPARAGRGGAAAAAGRDLDRAVPGPPVLPRTQRRARLRRQRPRRPGPHRRHRAPPGHRLPVPAGPVRRDDQRPGSRTPRTCVTGKTAPSGKKPYQQAAPESVLADVLQRDGGRPVRHRADPPRPGMGRGNRPPAPPVVRGHPAGPVPADR